MSGHSKWSQIKHQKGIADRKRGQTFTKLGNAITLAVVGSGGVGDPDNNFKLRLLMEKARAFNMPNSNIDRAIERGQGKGEHGRLEEITYEGFGPGNIAIIVQTATDNRQRTNANLKNLFTEYGGTLAGLGSVSYLFRNCGLLKIEKESQSFDKYLEIALEVGCVDVEDVGEAVFFYTEPAILHKVKNLLAAKKLLVFDAEIIYRPLTLVKVNDGETVKKIRTLISILENDDDVQKVAVNYDIK